MAGIGIFIEHRTKPGKRDEVYAVWKWHMASAISQNSGHRDYFYGFAEQDSDVLLVFQRYSSQDAAAAFLEHPAYLAYVSEVEHMLAGPPIVKSASIMWTKGEG